MANFTRNFIAGRMNKVVDQRLLPDGEYVDAMNIRMGSTENAEMGVVENTKGNLSLTTLNYNGTFLSSSARCIGAIENSATETIYWFVHDSAFTVGATGKLDLIVSFNVFTNILTYHVISLNDGGNVDTVLNFNPSYLITGVNILNDLLFFTDDYNAPRFINTNRNYANPVSNIDQFTAESLLVIKKPPLQSPTVQPIVNNGQENYLTTRFICFAYRYKYIDGEYSATSQWSQPSFVPNPFSFSIESFLNEGMTNFCNSAIITYNSGSSLVVGVDLLFKKADGIVIKVIEKLDKTNLGLANNTDYQYTFTNSKIFTILSESELLRLYDNVPRYAKAQTIMGNRLMYGNYIEGYDLIDEYGVPIKLEYSTDLVSLPIGNSNINDATAEGNYNIDGSISVQSSIVSFNLTGKSLVAGSAINLEVTIEHSQFSGQTPFPTQETTNVDLNFAFILSTTYTSVYALATSVEFQNVVGTSANIQSFATACTGTTFTDSVNCLLPNTLDAYTAIGSGISALAQPVAIITSPSSSWIGLQFIAQKFVDNTVTPTQTFYEYYQVVLAQASFQEIANPQSLHSNRDYEIGIVYMDEFNRATTALVSPNNTEHVPCGLASYKNSITVTIPATQKPPEWATRYKFVIKPDQENYETIYCSIFFQDPLTNNAYFLLEGENARKVEVGDRLIVKADSSGPTSSCVYATVLEKSSQSSDFIEIPTELDPTVFIPIPAGVYMKINPNSFNTVQDEYAIIAPGKITETEPKGSAFAPVLDYPMNSAQTAGFDPTNPTWEFSDYTVPSGSRIVFSIKQWRSGSGCQCEERRNTLEKTFVSSNTYDNMYDWFIGDNIEQFLDDGTRYASCGNAIPENTFISGTGNPISSTNLGINYYQFYRNPTTNELYLMVTGTFPCSGVGKPKARASNVEVNITVFRSEKNLIFETEPTDALPDVFFENEMSFAITGGNHMGNIQNQNIGAGTSAIIDTKFFNCFAFGNGAESYKIRDSIVGNSFNFGNRVTSVSAQDYKMADRFSDITYSGVYSAESNVNKLNEFNLGLLNYKVLEPSFGDIYILDGRANDILVLQEDKISYVLSSKNLISDSTGGGVIASVPEILGNQITRTEKYGISFNPESYIKWGYDRFFTDVKRGAVIQLRGNSYSNEELKVVSEMNMRTWFRDTFNESFNTQKLGGFDPYMNEYVLTSNTIAIPSNPQCINCGITQTFTLSSATSATTTYCVDLGSTVGNTDINYVVSSISAGGSFQIVATYNAISHSTGVVTTSGTLTFNKNNVSVETVTLVITYVGNITLGVEAECVQAASLSIVQIVLTSDYDSGQTINSQYRYVIGSYTSPLQSTFVTFASGTNNPLVSLYNITTNYVGTGGFPPATSTMSLISNKLASDTFVFDTATDRFKYLASDTLYANTTAGLNSLLALAITATPNLGSGVYNYANFTVPTLEDYLYLIWDFRSASAVELCYSETSTEDACCGCVLSPISYNCIEGNCTDPGDGSGVYATLEQCESACVAPTTVTLDWTVGQQSGGALTIFNNVMSQLLNVTSTSGSAQGGTIYPLISELPYTIRGEWVSGPSNIIQFNLCNISSGGTIYTSGAITVTEGYEDYLVLPTPIYVVVNLTAQNTSLPVCPL